MKKQHAGVSLLELLTVIAIIAILLAIIFPVMSRAKEGARVAVCSSNLRQIALAMAAYAGDFGALPWSADPHDPSMPVGAGDFPALRDCAKLYILNTDICQCPSHRGARAGIANAILSADASVRTCYDVLPAWTDGPAGGRGGDGGHTNVPLAWDINGGLSRERAAALPDAERRAAIAASNHYPRGGNVVYGDLHVRWLNANDWPGINDPGIPGGPKAR